MYKVCNVSKILNAYNGVEREPLRRPGLRTGSEVTVEAAEIGKSAIGHTFQNALR